MTDQNFINLKEKRDIGNVINASFSFLKIAYFKMLGNLLIYSAPLYIIGAVISSGKQYISLSGTDTSSLYLYTHPEYYYGIIFDLLGYIMTYTIVTNYILQYTQTGSVDFNHNEVLTNVKSDYLKVLGASFLYWVATILGIVLLIIPGLYYSVSRSLARTILILEKKSVNDSFSESSRLVTDNWWRTFGLFYLITFLTAFLSMVFVIPNLIVVFLLKLHLRTGDMEDYHLFYTISLALTNIGTCLLYPLTVTAMAIYTFSLKESRDKDSLLSSIESIGSQPIEKKEDEGSY